MSSEDGTTWTWDTGYRASHLRILPGCPLRTEQLGPGTQGIEHHISGFFQDVHWGQNNSDLGRMVLRITSGHLVNSPRMSSEDRTTRTWDAWYILQTSQEMSPYGWYNLTQIWVVDSWFYQDFQGSEQLRSGTQSISSVTLGHFVIIPGCSSKAKGHFVIPRISP